MENAIIKEDISFVRLDKDTSPVNYQPGSYFDLLNMRVISDDNSQSTSLTNFKGNSYITAIPETPAVNKIIVLDATISFPGSYDAITINIGGITNIMPSGFAVSLEDYYQQIIDFINTGVFPAVDLAYLQSDSKAIMIQFLVTLGATSIGTILTTTGPTQIFNAGEFIPFLQNLKIIGWVNLRETIYLLTTNNSNTNPGNVDGTGINLDQNGVPVGNVDPSAGQIWRLTYDKVTKVVNPLELLYNNYINLTIQHPIANPGGIEGRYENTNIQKIYWTDNFNTLRSFNVIDPNGFALLPTSLDIASSIQHTVPILDTISQGGGSLITGIHQIAYRLKNTGGGETTFSIPSNLVHITTHSENLPYGGRDSTDECYEGSDVGTVSSKALIFTIKDLDTSYNRIEIVSLVRENKDQSPNIDIIMDYPLSQTGNMTITYTGNEPKIPITLNEFNGFLMNFKTVKTITQKNNKLFPGNVRIKNFDIDWDSRAYRFKSTAGTISDTTTAVIDVTGTSFNINSVDWTYDGTGNQLPNNHDAIQSYDVFQSPLSWGKYLYQAGNAILGGEGPNVKYTFTNCDITNPDLMVMDWHIDKGGTQSRAPYRTSEKYSTIFDLDNQTSQEFPLKEGYIDHHHSSVSGLLKGFQRDEMYRFGVIFYDVLGNPSFVKWIADIRMPHIYMPDLTNPVSTTRTLQYPLTTQAGNALLGYNIGIDFTFDFSSLSQVDKDKIRGFSVVRTKREDFDKHVVGQGSLNPVIYDVPNTGETFTLFHDTNIEPSAVIDTTVNGMTIDSPEFYFNQNPIFNTNDTIDVIGILENTDDKDIEVNGGGTNPTRFKVIKNYVYETAPPESIANTTGFSNNPYAIESATPLTQWYTNQNQYITPLGTTLWNKGYQPIAGKTKNMGGFTLYVEGTGVFDNFPALGGDDFLNTDGMYSTYKQYICNYKRQVLNQYGGNSFSQRSNNEYILCSDYFPIPITYNKDIIPPDPYICRIYGGDTFVCVYDHVKMFPNFATGVDYQLDAIMVGRLFPVECSVNLELRQAKKISSESSGSPAQKYKYVFNKQTVPDLDVLGVSESEEFTYNNVYSSDNDVKIFFPQPDPYVPNEEFDVRIYNSEEKNNGELADSWGIYKEANFIDVDGTLGPINNLITLNNSLLYFQDKGVGKVSVEEKAAVATSTGDLTIGTSGILSRFDYITRASGSKHQFGFTQNDDTVWYFDIIQKTLFELTPQGNIPVSDIKGLHSHFQQNLIGDIITTDNPYIGLGITATYDFEHKEAVFTFLDTDNQFTVSYVTRKKPDGEMSRDFISFYSYTPGFYINDKYNIITSNTGSDLWMHDLNDNHALFYSTQYPCKLTIISNKYAKNTKILTNLEWLTESLGYNNPPGGQGYTNEICDILNDTWDIIRIRNSKQNTDFQAVQQLAKRKERTWNMKVPKDRMRANLTNASIYGTELSPVRIAFAKKMRDKYQFIDFQYNNNTNVPNNKFIMHYLTNLLRISPR